MQEDSNAGNPKLRAEIMQPLAVAEKASVYVLGEEEDPWNPEDDLDCTLDRLYAECLKLERSPLAPEGAWIEEGKVSGKRRFRQAYWRAQHKIFVGVRSGAPSHRRYIGKVGSSKHKAAIAAWQNRHRLNEVKRQIHLWEQIKIHKP